MLVVTCLVFFAERGRKGGLVNSTVFGLSKEKFFSIHFQSVEFLLLFFSFLFSWFPLNFLRFFAHGFRIHSDSELQTVTLDE